ncbi:hypothetical protein BD560DRAFT_411329 [Blakeslea trispora]|nr:hypothetical protein BD560DRAFT_411329 [Blakeslea trispora]
MSRITIHLYTHNQNNDNDNCHFIKGKKQPNSLWYFIENRMAITTIDTVDKRKKKHFAVIENSSLFNEYSSQED